jgi:hypothetical protein
MDEKIDRRRNYILVLDTETANSQMVDNRLDPTNCLFYDMGWQVVDKHGNVYEKASFVNADIYIDEKELMKSAYYANKLPQYERDLKTGKRKLATTKTIRKQMCDTITKYRIKAVSAHNARFDYNTCNATQRWVTKSKFRYFFPKDVEIWDTLKMARDVILKMPTYRRFCEEHGLLTKNGRLSATAENLYRFIIKDPTFVESHTGLEDVEIETQILAYCYKQHKKMRKKLWEN